MDYQNRPVPEGINVSQEHPLREFFILLGGVGGLLLVALLALSLAAGWLVRFVPFSAEQQLAGRALTSLPGPARPLPLTAEQQRVQRYLEQLAQPLAEQAGLPPEVRVQVHFVPDDTVNAFAALGGHIMVHAGLYRAMPSENALAMVLAHEIAHVKHRDPLVAAGRGVVVLLALSSLSGLGEGAVQQLLGSVGTATVLGFSREQESAADAEALRVLAGHYGHIAGAERVFEILAAQHPEGEPPLLFSTHPHSEARILSIREAARHYPASGELRPLAVALPAAR